MYQLPAIQALIYASLAWALLLALVRGLLIHRLTMVSADGDHHLAVAATANTLPAPPPSPESNIAGGELIAARGPAAAGLRPAELAYLIREGDLSHTMVVLAFDLLHRAVKAHQSGEPIELTSYERKIWGSVKDFLRSWADKQAKKVIPDPRIQSPAEVVARLSRIFRFLVEHVRQFVAQVTADPRNVRRYFSFAGVTRLVADLFSSGYQQAVAAEILLELDQRGLLVPEARRKCFALILRCLCGVGLLATVALTVWLVPALALALLLMGACNAVGLRMAFLLFELIPFFWELRDVIDHVQRPGWRIALFKNLVRGIVLTICCLLVVAAALLLSAEFLILKFLLLAGTIPVLGALASLTLTWLVLVELALDGHRLEWRPQASAAARALISQARQRLSSVSPFETFRQVLADTEYDPLFSELLALYGIETLGLLA